MKIRFALLATLIFSIASPVPSLAAGERFALVIGNAKYPDADAPLKEPINDARDVADELKRDGFTVDIGENLTGDGMRRAFDKLYAKIKPGSVALIFFSGYGIQSNRQSYMIPVDAQIWAEPDIRRDGISLETVLGEINSRGAGVKIALIDASRRNPFERRFRSFSAGLAPVIAPNGTLVMYSAALSSVVSDNGSDHSLFVRELLKEIRTPDLMAEETLNRTRVGVTRASRQEQVPWISSSLAEDFSFIPGGAPQPASLAPAAPAAEAAAPQPTPAPPTRPAPPVQTATAPTPPSLLSPPPPPKQAEITLPPPPPQAPTVIEPSPTPTSPAALALADDPTIKGLSNRLDKNPDDAAALYRRGQVYASKGAYQLAISDFTNSLRLNPKDVEAYNNRCWVRTVIGDLQAALKDCNEALRLRPNFVDALDSRGLMNLKSGQNKNAIADFDAALKINPRLTSSLYGRGLAKKRNGAIAEGDLDIANAKAMDPNIVKEFAEYGVK
ncbi:caspase family protein [Bradyrhizobium sp. ISRA443]|uniref:caspase family protein n=1 Tax=unclassified Bradyrhizobium TaxID=2631580 RepID=UPI0024791BDB|nr:MULTISPECIES: caspase family protein [unclassified Bradyrhizobium]WGR94897.1 caspase family protein [Bradyrhizobium sp. ISRA435]WGR99756.1 caspase family protein [Bradyrhizobium sp. ISRA436]WGS06646.1 caspase family protein [Bradyrhizobium sp. ISRA437]WGS13530.1 caspase family protein [Bradyrhizobium sp. ISRA443]